MNVKLFLELEDQQEKYNELAVHASQIILSLFESYSTDGHELRRAYIEFDIMGDEAKTLGTNLLLLLPVKLRLGIHY